MAPIQCESEQMPPRPYEEIPEGEDRQIGKKDSAPNSILPGCSDGKDHVKKWDMTTSMMQAYLALRGPGADIEDPLLSWIDQQDKKNVKAGESGLLHDIDDSIKERVEWDGHGPARFSEEERRAVFQYTRPKIDHLHLPESFDRDALEEVWQNSDGWYRYAASEVSDDEGDPADGRISPCTFARWAEGAKKWDAPGDKYKSMWEPRKTYEIPEERQRPPSPNTAEPRTQKFRDRELQIDEDDGRLLSAACSEFAETEPSLVWSPPPMKAALPTDFFTHKMDRMDPELAKALREGVTATAPSFGVGSFVEDTEVFSRSIIENVVDTYWGLEHTSTIIAGKHRDLAFLRYNEEQVNLINEKYRHDIRHLKHENRKLGDCLVLRQDTRNRRILRSVDRHIRGLDYEGKAKLAEVKARHKENEQLRKEYENMKGMQKRLLVEFNKDTPEEVFEMFPYVWESLERRKNRRNFS